MWHDAKVYVCVCVIFVCQCSDPALFASICESNRLVVAMYNLEELLPSGTCQPKWDFSNCEALFWWCKRMAVTYIYIYNSNNKSPNRISIGYDVVISARVYVCDCVCECMWCEREKWCAFNDLKFDLNENRCYHFNFVWRVEATCGGGKK